jgi:hypothetical protein
MGGQMKHVRVLGVGLMMMLGVLAFAVTASSSATIVLPDLHVLSAESYPLYLSFPDNKSTPMKLISAFGGKLIGTGVLLLFLTFELSSLGSFEVLFLKVTEPKENRTCNTGGDKEGEVLIKGSFHIVPTAATGTPAILYEFRESSLECGKGIKSVKIKGDSLSPVNLGTTKESEDYTSLGTEFEGNGKGKPSLTEYISDSGTKVKVKLESEFGTGFAESAEEVGEEVCPETEKKMFSILDR